MCLSNLFIYYPKTPSNDSYSYQKQTQNLHVKSLIWIWLCSVFLCIRVFFCIFLVVLCDQWLSKGSIIFLKLLFRKKRKQNSGPSFDAHWQIFHFRLLWRCYSFSCFARAIKYKRKTNKIKFYHVLSIHNNYYYSVIIIITGCCCCYYDYLFLFFCQRVCAWIIIK